MRYKNKKILLMGLGGFAKGSGISAAEFLASRGADLTITDLKTKKELVNNLAVLKKYKNLKYVLGEHREKDFAAADWVIKNPDVPMNSLFLKIAQKRKIPIDNDITLFFREYGVKNVIGVTGTRGKSTTASLIFEMVRRQYPAARLGGNIGESPLRFLFCHPERLFCHSERSEESLAINVLKDPSVATLSQDDNKRNPVVLELSSFQLHNLDTIKTSPHIAVWTNFYLDHLNKYPSLADYKKDKEKIFKYQKAGDVAVLNWDDPACRLGSSAVWPLSSPRKPAPCLPAGRYRSGRRGSSDENFHPSIFWFSLRHSVKNGAFIKNNWFVFSENGQETKIAPVSATKLLGAHNQANILAAICATRAYGIKWSAICAAIHAFKGAPNRLEIIKKIRGITFVNDCTATSPEAAMAALKSFPAKKIILISGGNSKGSSLKELAETIAARARVLILVPGNANKELRRLVILSVSACLPAPAPCLPAGRYRSGRGRKNPLSNVIPSTARNLQEAIKESFKNAEPGDIILFSPGLTWLPRQNEFARGEEFEQIVKNLKK